MLYNFNGNYINVSEIALMKSGRGNNPKHPFELTVYLKNGQSVGVCYASEQTRNAEAQRIDNAFRRSVPEPVNRYEVETIVSSYIGKVRNDFRQLKKMIKDGTAHE